MFKNCKVVGSNVDADAYHRVTEPRGSREFPMSPSALKEFAHCACRWVNGYSGKETKAKKWGSLLDALLLTPDLFDRRYLIQKDTYPAPAGHAKVKRGQISEGDPLPWNNNATYCSEWTDAAKASGKEIIPAKKVQEANDAISRLMSDEILAAFLKASDRQVMVCGEWHDAPSGIVIPVRCLIDLVPRADTEFARSLGDLKSTTSLSIGAFNRQIYAMKWHWQAAFDMDILYAALNSEPLRRQPDDPQPYQWVFVAQENYEPWEPGRKMLGSAYVELGRAEYIKALRNYCACLKAGQWPSYDDTDESVQGWTLCDPEAWMENESLFAPRFALEQEQEVEEEAGSDLIP